MQLLPRCYPLPSQKMLSALSSGLLSRFFSWIVSISGSPLPPEDNMSFHKRRNSLGSVWKNHRICDLQMVRKLKRGHVEDHRMLAIFRCLKDSLTIIKKTDFCCISIQRNPIWKVVWSQIIPALQSTCPCDLPFGGTIWNQCFIIFHLWYITKYERVSLKWCLFRPFIEPYFQLLVMTAYFSEVPQDPLKCFLGYTT